MKREQFPLTRDKKKNQRERLHNAERAAQNPQKTPALTVKLNLLHTSGFPGPDLKIQASLRRAPLTPNKLIAFQNKTQHYLKECN